MDEQNREDYTDHVPQPEEDTVEVKVGRWKTRDGREVTVEFYDPDRNGMRFGKELKHLPWIGFWMMSTRLPVTCSWTISGRRYPMSSLKSGLDLVEFLGDLVEQQL
jgi:hypothetical protein